MIQVSIVKSGVLVREYNSENLKKEVKLLTSRTLKSKKGRQYIVFLLAIALIVMDCYSNTLTAPVFGNLDKVDQFGMQLLNIARRFGKYIFLVMGCTNVIKDAMEGADKDVILKTVIKYLLAYGCLFALPWLFDFIETSF